MPRVVLHSATAGHSDSSLIERNISSLSRIPVLRVGITTGIPLNQPQHELFTRTKNPLSTTQSEIKDEKWPCFCWYSLIIENQRTGETGPYHKKDNKVGAWWCPQCNPVRQQQLFDTIALNPGYVVTRDCNQHCEQECNGGQMLAFGFIDDDSYSDIARHAAPSLLDLNMVSASFTTGGHFLITPILLSKNMTTPSPMKEQPFEEVLARLSAALEPEPVREKIVTESYKEKRKHYIHTVLKPSSNIIRVNALRDWKPPEWEDRHSSGSEWNVIAKCYERPISRKEYKALLRRLFNKIPYDRLTSWEKLTLKQTVESEDDEVSQQHPSP